MSINDLSRACYQCARTMRNIRAIQRTLQTGDPTYICKRCIRRAAYKTTYRGLRKALRQIGM